MTERVIVEADGGSRGNPGPAAYGALVRDAHSGAVLATRGETIGTATNNVAEYRGLLAGLELAREHAPDADIEVRMDSKLVIEQMAGRWKIKHADMRALALEARPLCDRVVQWQWIPRDQNTAADALANQAMDEQARTGRPAVVGTASHPEPTAPPPEPASPSPERTAPSPEPVEGPAAPEPPRTGWAARRGEPTTLVLLRHGVTENTVRKALCGSGGSDPELTEEGRAQAARAAAWVARHHRVDAIVSSPLRRARSTADVVARELDLTIEQDPDLTETDFGSWEGRTFAELLETHGPELKAWTASPDSAPHGGESFTAVDQRVRAARERIVERHPGETVLLVSHVTPIKLLVRAALDVDFHVLHAMELAPASLTTLAWWPDGTASLRSFSVVPD